MQLKVFCTLKNVNNWLYARNLGNRWKESKHCDRNYFTESNANLNFKV